MNQFISNRLVWQIQLIPLIIAENYVKAQLLVILSRPHTSNGCNQFFLICNRDLRGKHCCIAAVQCISAVISDSCAIAETIVFIAEAVIYIWIIWFDTIWLTIKNSIYASTFRVIFYHPVVIVKFAIYGISCHQYTGRPCCVCFFSGKCVIKLLFLGGIWGRPSHSFCCFFPVIKAAVTIALQLHQIILHRRINQLCLIIQSFLAQVLPYGKNRRHSNGHEDKEYCHRGQNLC